MAYVVEYEHDVFISYAHVDNEPLVGATEGWVTTLVRNLETVLRQKLGDREHRLSVWMDHELAGNRPFGADIDAALERTATLLVIVSPGYLTSDWCSRERETFRRLVASRSRSGSRVFIVHRDRLELTRLPREFEGLLGYRFWVEEGPARTPRTLGVPVPTAAELEYYGRVNQLALEVADELQRLGGGPAAAVSVAARVAESVTAGGPTLFLAEVTDDLEPRREAVRRYLVQLGFEVLPASEYPRADARAFEQAVNVDLARSRLFVQLLSEVVGRKPPVAPRGFPARQYELACAAKIPVLQWRARELAVETVVDVDQRALLQEETVRACAIEEFKQAVSDEGRREPVMPAPPRGEVLLFLDCEDADRELAEQIGGYLLANGIGFAEPLRAGSPEEIRKDLERSLEECDGLMLIYGQASPSWIRSRLRQCRKLVSQRDEPPVALAVFEGPPAEKPEVGISIPGWQWINCRAGRLEQCLGSVVDRVRS
ncbi:MAG: toll/interleukin-1 receptor domain-containing protein [Candidatus Accumulibacter sp. UW26]|jgi:hypothetical protein